jgi:hypothetical protein
VPIELKTFHLIHLRLAVLGARGPSDTVEHRLYSLDSPTVESGERYRAAAHDGEIQFDGTGFDIRWMLEGGGGLDVPEY